MRDLQVTLSHLSSFTSSPWKTSSNWNVSVGFTDVHYFACVAHVACALSTSKLRIALQDKMPHSHFTTIQTNQVQRLQDTA